MRATIPTLTIAFFWTLALIPVGSADADLARYFFSGVLPTGSSAHSQVADGEDFLAEFIVDRAVLDSDGRTEFGRYNGSVVSGSLSFSGGYASNFDFSGFNVGVGNDFSFNSNVYDEVSVSNDNIWFIANTLDTTALSSDGMPNFETIAPGPIPDLIGQFSFEDGGGSIAYDTGNSMNHNSFTAASIPEPSALFLMSAVGLGFIGFRRRTD